MTREGLNRDGFNHARHPYGALNLSTMSVDLFNFDQGLEPFKIALGQNFF